MRLTPLPRTHLLSLLAPLAACPSSPSDPGSVAGTSGTTTTTAEPDPPDPPTSTTAGPPTSTSTLAPDPTTTTTTTTTTTANTTAAASSGETTTTGALDDCGDGELDPGETCDLGHGKNSDAGACTLGCQKAECGDGLVHIGKEECDAGGDNNGDTYGGCTTTCKLGARCGDGTVNGPEECDLGDADNGTGEHNLDGVPCSDTCRHAGLLVFLSSVAYTGKLGGVHGADGHCQQLATDAGLDNANHFKAWLSDDMSSPYLRFDPAVDGLPYALLSGLRVADDREQLLQSGPLTGITMTEKGETLLDAAVWTNTTSTGVLLDASLDCAAWKIGSFEFKGSVGRSGVDKQDFKTWQQWKNEHQWTSYATLGCHKEARLFCFEQ